MFVTSADGAILNMLSKGMTLDKLRQLKIKYLVTSSFLYERYEYGAKLSSQNPRVYARNNIYKELFLYQYIEIKPAYKSFAFSNPTMRIIDITEKIK